MAVRKAQAIRLLDVFAIGPAMVAGGVLLQRSRSPVLGMFLIVTGLGTVVFNGANFIRQEQRTAAAKRLYDLDLD